MAIFSIGDWVFSSIHRESVRILDVETVWGRSVYQVWVPRLGAMERVPAESLSAGQADDQASLDRILYAISAAKIADALTQDVLLAPLEAGVIPLPHQLHALSRAVTGDCVRFLLADEVGLGKTIEAGLIFRELKLRGLVKRVLVVAPKGLVTQWVQEMQTHFGESFRLLTPSEFSSYRSLTGTENVWRQFDQVVCPVDSIKPVERRRGWSNEKLETYNQERIGDLIDAGWDLIICDEAHRLGGSTEQVARYRLGKALAEAAPYLLLLSATPHQGKTDGFQRIMALLDKEEFIPSAPIRKEKVAPFVIRTEKRRAINDKGDPLFLPRSTKLVPVRWIEKHALQRKLYESVTEYVRIGYNQAIKQNRQYLGFLMILMQRLVTSSTYAVASALEKRLEALNQSPLTPALSPDGGEGEEDSAVADADSQEQLDELLARRLTGLQNEKEEVTLLLELARRCQAQGPDARAETLLEILYENQRAENNPELKYLIFTEFVPTQNMLKEFLAHHGFSVVCLNGSMDLDQRREVQTQFAQTTRVLVSTDAGGEGLNLQFAHIVINYDLPWNPMRIEQRIGRVDRIGQKHPVKAFNLIFEESVELRVREVLEEKLTKILEEFGVSKTQDVLDSTENGAMFEKFYAQAIIDPNNIDSNLNALAMQVREQAEYERSGRSYYGDTVLDPQAAQQLSQHPLPFWVERMTTAYLRSEGGKVGKDLFSFSLHWADGHTMDRVSFRSRDAQDNGLRHVSLEEPRVRRLVTQLPRVSATDPIPRLRFAELAEGVIGYWSLWRIGIVDQSAGAAADQSFRQVKIIPIFHHDDGRNLSTTARHIWDSLMEEGAKVELLGNVDATNSRAIYDRLRADAERLGENAYRDLYERHQSQLKREREKGEYAFQMRRDALNRVGLSQVRQHRLRLLEEDVRVWTEALRKREQIMPELLPVLILRVEAEHG